MTTEYLVSCDALCADVIKVIVFKRLFAQIFASNIFWLHLRGVHSRGVAAGLWFELCLAKLVQVPVVSLPDSFL